MRCPYCGHEDTQVRDSRPTEDDTAIRRRRVCPNCNGRFTTFERVQLRELMVVKRSGRRERFDREKLARSVATALRKRVDEPDTVDALISRVVRHLEKIDTDIPTEFIGEMVMTELKRIDDVAYVRFASVYRNFREAKDFESVLDELAADRPAPVPAPVKPRRAE